MMPPKQVNKEREHKASPSKSLFSDVVIEDVSCKGFKTVDLDWDFHNNNRI